MLGGGGFGGGFLNMGTPELVVIGAVAWVVLGPKELFRLSKEAGKFIGEWQQLGMQAKNTFTDALETELAEDQVKQAKESFQNAANSFKEGVQQGASGVKDGFEEGFSSEPPAPEWARQAGMGAASFNEGLKEGEGSKEGETPPYAEWAAEAGSSSSGEGFDAVGKGSDPSSVPTLEEMAANRAATEEGFSLSPEEEAKVREQMYAELGRPEDNERNFAEQLSGARNAAVLSEYPAELTSEDAPQDGSPLDVTSAEEGLLENQIAETENELATLRAEKQVLALKRKQLEQNMLRAQKMAEERDAAADERLAEAEAKLEAAEKEGEKKSA